MSGRGPGGGRGPDDGYYGPGYDGPGTTAASSGSNSSNSGSSNLPVWALVLIMVGSGLITLTFLWLCVLFICRKRRARRAAVRDDLEVQTGSFQSERETARILGPVQAGINKEEDAAKRCESEAGVELTFVVMAGEDQPSYLAKPAPQQQTMNPTTTAGDPAAKTIPEANSQLEKQTQQQRSAASETPPPRVDVVDRKSSTPPSPS